MEPVWHVTVDGVPARAGAEGFIHASFPAQLAGTLAAHFRGAQGLVLLRLDVPALGDTLVVEPSRGGQLFPHVYGVIRPEHVLERVSVARGASGDFDLSAIPGAAAGPAPTASGPAGAVRLTPLPQRPPWGSRRLAALMGWPDRGDVGEWWLLSCHPKGITHLARGGEPLGAWLDGPAAPPGLPRAAKFPLLLKFLDTAQVLSVQVHPDDVVARALDLPNGKTEAWHILAADPGACLFVGTAEGVGVGELLDRAQGGTDRAGMARLLRRVPAVPGETWLVEAGTIHAVGPGVTLFEIQQTSDATFRIYDWERQPPRELHLAKARRAARDLPPAAPAPPPGDAPGWSLLVRCPAFELQHGRVDGRVALPRLPACAGLTVLGGRGACVTGGQRHALAPGDTLLCWGEGTLEGEGLTLLLALPGR